MQDIFRDRVQTEGVPFKSHRENAEHASYAHLDRRRPSDAESRIGNVVTVDPDKIQERMKESYNTRHAGVALQEFNGLAISQSLGDGGRTSQRVRETKRYSTSILFQIFGTKFRSYGLRTKLVQILLEILVNFLNGKFIELKNNQVSASRNRFCIGTTREPEKCERLRMNRNWAVVSMKR